ncbi:conserved hypothetical protein [Cupriavidus necator]|uniref:Uncharacterized protein n=1 Tax=Cupriavidus necator TaxID=106590 RepID=A0A1K0ISI9_CUPNE|nr:conserved hypothetical protein [Cupriavidus necator]
MNKSKVSRTTDLQRLYRHASHVDDFLINRDDPESNLSSPEIRLLAKLDRFVWLSLETEFSPFSIQGGAERIMTGQQNEHGHLLPKTASLNQLFVSRELGRDLVSSLPRALEAIATDKTAANQLRYAPHIQLLLEVFLGHPLRSCKPFKKDWPIGQMGEIMAEVHNDFVAQFRKAMLARRLLRRELHNWNWGSQENLDNLNFCLDDLFDRHGNLTILHLRLFHDKNRANLISASVEDQYRDFHALRACRTKFLDRMRRKRALFPDKPGYIWSIIPSLEGGYELHLTLLFDTATLRKLHVAKHTEATQAGAVLEDHADQVGKYWVSVATGGRGSYLPGDRDIRQNGRDWVHGEVSADDTLQREKLKNALGYLVTRRALVRLKNEPEGEYFGMRERKSRAAHQLVKEGEKGK